MIMELKWKPNLDENALSKLATEGLKQIHENRYEIEMKNEGVQTILSFGVAFSGKKACIKSEG